MPNDDTRTDEQILEDAVFEAEGDNELSKPDRAVSIGGALPPSSVPSEGKGDESTFTQWAIGGNGRFTPVGASVEKVKAGIYEAFATSSSWGLERLNVSSDEIYELPDMATAIVLDEAEKFWNNEDRYRKHKLCYKRGLIMHGPPGSGKTVTLKLLIKKLIDRDGIVLVIQNVQLSILVLKAIKRIEPKRNLICIFEDIDEIIHSQGEATVLSMLDGEHNVDRVMNIATTNYPDLLGARIINRPSRFDRRIHIGMPGPDARQFYLKMATHDALSEKDLKQWVVDTDEMSIAHLRELVAAVYCLDQPYKDVIERLSEMAKKVKAEQEFKGGKTGFGSSGPKTSRLPTW